jgi:hypothetical protein
MHQYRQGDVLLQSVARLPKRTRTVPRDNGRLVLAYGELTGHAHVVEGEAELLASDVAELEERFLRVTREARLVHNEHQAITLPPGDYAVRRQREYTPGRIRIVTD